MTSNARGVGHVSPPDGIADQRTTLTAFAPGRSTTVRTGVVRSRTTRVLSGFPPAPTSWPPTNPRTKQVAPERLTSTSGPKRELGLRTLDLAKRLLDFSFHPPTVYFPLIVDEALLVEPTETETKETLDAFAEALANILREGAEDPEIARNAPYGTPVRRLDEAGAAKRPVIRQPL